jgi:hypothetical protein
VQTQAEQLEMKLQPKAKQHHQQANAAPAKIDYDECLSCQ